MINFSLLLQIAALSPADINHDETMSTLRYGKKHLLCSSIALKMKIPRTFLKLKLEVVTM